MKHKSQLLFTFLSAFLGFLFWACQDDDICVDSISPRLIITFTDTSGERVTLDELYVERLAADASNLRISDIDSLDVDSISLDLPTETNPIEFLFYRSEITGTNTDIIDTIEVAFDLSQQFVSKGCGFRNIYNNLDINDPTKNNLNAIDQLVTTISDESETHLIITFN